MNIAQKRNVARFREILAGNYIFPVTVQSKTAFDEQYKPREITVNLTADEKLQLRRADGKKRQAVRRAGGREVADIAPQPLVKPRKARQPTWNQLAHEFNRNVIVEPIQPKIHQPVIRRIIDDTPKIHVLTIVNQNNTKLTVAQAYNINFVGCRLVVNNIAQAIQMFNKIVAYAREMYRQTRINKRFRIFFRNMRVHNANPFASSALIYASNSIEKIADTRTRLEDIQRRWLKKAQQEDSHYDEGGFDDNIFFSNVRVSMEQLVGGCGNRHEGRKNTEFLPSTFGDMKVFSPPSRDNNCGLELIRRLNSSIPSCLKLRKQLDIPSKEKISPEQLNKLCLAYKMPATLMDIQGYDLINNDLVDFDKLSPLVFIYDQEHWFQFMGFENMKVCMKCKKAYREKHVCNEKMIQFQRLRDLKGTNWLKFDLETRNSLKEKSQVHTNVYYRQIETKLSMTYSLDFDDEIPKTESYLGLDCMTWMIDKLLANNHLNVCHSHNGSRFDMFFVLNELQSRPDFDIRQCLIKGSKILSIKYQNLIFLDTMNSMAGSLDKLCDDFKVKQKKIKSFVIDGKTWESMEICLMKQELDADEFIAWISQEENKEYRLAYKTYCEFDTKSLFELHSIFCLQMNILKSKEDDLVRTLPNNECKKKAMAKCDIRKATTLSGYSDKMFHALYMEEEGCSLYQTEGEEALFLEKLICGGISEVFQAGTHKNFTCVDVVSLYVSEMMNRQYPIGKPRQTTSYQAGKMGGYRCTNIHQATKHVMDFPLQSKTGLDWKKNYIPEAFLTSVDIERMRGHGSTMNIHEGYYWESCTTKSPFYDYLNVFTAEKIRQDTLKQTPEYNEALRTVCKLMGNSLYGRQLMKIQADEYRNIESLADPAYDSMMELNSTTSILASGGKVFAKSKAEEKTYGCLQYGVFILAYARDTLQKYMDICGREKVIATETDSIYLDHEGFQRLKDAGVIGKKLGQLEQEFKNCELGYFTGKKQYFLLHPDGKENKMRGKGVSGSLLCQELYESLIKNGKYTVTDMVQFKRQLLTANYTGIQVGRVVKVLKATLKYQEW